MMSFEDTAQNDAAVFMDIFGIPAVISDSALHKKDTRAVFDINSIDSIGVITDKPQVSILTADLAEFDIKNTVLTVRDTEYRILKPLPDGYGLSLATLARI
jgi:hypothetical protein